MWLLWSLTGQPAVLLGIESWKKKDKMGGQGMVRLCGFTCLHYGNNVKVSFSFPPISGWATSLRTEMFNEVLRLVFDLLRHCLLTSWGIKGQCPNRKHLCITGSLPCQFAHRRNANKFLRRRRTWKSSRIPWGSSKIKDIHSFSGDPELGPMQLKFTVHVPHSSAFGDSVLSRPLLSHTWNHCVTLWGFPGSWFCAGGKVPAICSCPPPCTQAILQVGNS